MEEPHSDPRVSFARQRRSLLAVSLVLLALQWSGATFEKLVLLGNTIALKAPLDIARPLWVAWFYFVLRAYQHYRALPGEPVVAPIRDRTNVEMLRVARRIATEELRETLEADMQAPTKITITVDGESIIGYDPMHWSIELRGEVTAVETKTTRGLAKMRMLDPYGVQVPTRHLLVCRARASIWVALNTTAVTEYILPGVVALLPLARSAAALVRTGLLP